MIKESKGTPDLIKSFIKSNNEKIINCIDNYQGSKFSFNSNIDIIINFNESVEYGGKFNFLEAVNSKFKNCVITINYPKIFDYSRVIKILSHELAHLYELYQVKDFYSDTKWERSQALVDTKNQDSVDKGIEYFRKIFYLSLPHEINARVSSLYFYLPKKVEKEKLEEELKKTIEWSNYLNLIDFPVDELFKNLMKSFDNDKRLLYYIINEFNRSMSIKTIINNDNDLYNYLLSSKRYFKSVAKVYKKKMLRVIDSIIEENKIQENIDIYTTGEHIIVNFKDYLNQGKIERRDYLIDAIIENSYQKFFK